MTTTVWFVALEAPGRRAEWDWDSLGAPDPRELLQTRRASSGDFSRHTPRTARSVTTGGTLGLESGLEHDLVRWVDQRTDVNWIVAQPVVLHFPVPGRRRAVIHTPDLLTSHADGTITIWDARPAARQDELFARKAALTETACRDVGWRYEVFEGLPVPHRMNLLWLAGFRRPMPWHAQRRAELEKLAARGPVAVSSVHTADDGSGELISTMWHLIWQGTLGCDTTAPIRSNTTLNWIREPSTKTGLVS